MTTLVLSTLLTKSECLERMPSMLDGKAAFRWLSWTPAASQARLVGTLRRDGGFDAWVIDPLSPLQTRLATVIPPLRLQSATIAVRVQVSSAPKGGAKVRAIVRPAVGDMAFLGLFGGLVAAAYSGDPWVVLSAVPFALLFYVTWPIARRSAVARATDHVVRRAEVALEATPDR